MTASFKTKSVSSICASIALLAMAQGVHAEEASDCGLRIGGGPNGGVYELLVKDIEAACGAVVPVCGVPSKGGLQNLMKLSANEVDVGVAQVDTLLEMSRNGDDNIRDLQAVMPLHSNLLHILTLKTGSYMGGWNGIGGETKFYRKFSDLKGVKVAVVSSAQLVGQKLNNQLGYGMDFILAESEDEAVEMLRKNKVQAIFTTGGWPYPAITRHPSNSNLMLAEFDIPAQSPFTVTKRNYQNLGAFNFSFLAAQNLLLTRPFKPNGEMGKKVAALQRCLVSKLNTLQEGRFHAAWKEIKSPYDTMGVSRFNGDGAKTVASKQ
jgi:TRAP-type uncharacterized transport system substrate-binding protein